MYARINLAWYGLKQRGKIADRFHSFILATWKGYHQRITRNIPYCTVPKERWKFKKIQNLSCVEHSTHQYWCSTPIKISILENIYPSFGTVRRGISQNIGNSSIFHTSWGSGRLDVLAGVVQVRHTGTYKLYQEKQLYLVFDCVQARNSQNYLARTGTGQIKIIFLVHERKMW